MSYCWFNRKELLEKAHKKYHKECGKEQAASYQRNKEAVKKRAREAYRHLSKEEKEKKRIFKK